MDPNSSPLTSLPLLAPTHTSVENRSVVLQPLPLLEPPPHTFRTILCISCSHEINIPVYCGDRWCPVCSTPRVKRIRSRILHCIAHQTRRPGATFKHLTLTIRNSESLAEQVKHLVASFRRLRQRAFFKKAVIGGAFVIEITGEHGCWHAHIHAVLYSYYMHWEKLYRLWHKVSGGQHIHIGMVPPLACAKYLTKYVSKGCDIPEHSRVEANEALKSFRLYNPFGSWYHLSAEYVPDKPGCPMCGGHQWCSLDYLENCNRYDYAFIQYCKLHSGLAVIPPP